MKNLMEQYDELSKATNEVFDELVKDGKTFSFIDDILTDNDSDDIEAKLFEIDEIGEISSLPTIERINESNGDSIDCYVSTVSSEQIQVSDMDEPRKVRYVKFSDIFNIYYRIQLVDDMKALLK